MLIELDPVDRITADALGPPGDRTFFIQARKAGRLVSVVVEKEQVQLLAASVVEILSRLGKETGEGPSEEEMGLEEPVSPEWRAGRLSIGYEEDRDLMVLEAVELVPGEEDDDEAEGDLGELERTLEEEELALNLAAAEVERELEALDEVETLEDLERMQDPEHPEHGEPAEGPAREPGRVRFWATREQMLSLARHGASVCARGRPRCRLCGNPIDPEGHACPALNGHRDLEG